MDYILLIEGSNSFSSLFRDRVNNTLKVEVIIAKSFTAAKELINDNNNHFSMAVLSDSLPDIANDEAVDFLLQTQIPCITLTADYNKDLQQSLLNKGVLDYFVKDGPGIIDSIIHAIDHYIHNKNICILVADDSKSIRVHLNNLLSRYGYKVILAEDGRIALRMIAEQRVDLIISDYQMPNMDGLKMVKKLRTRYSRDEVAVIGLSSADDHDLAVRFIKSGANDYLAKPYRPEELMCRVFQNIDIIERRKELSSLIERHQSILTHALDAIITTDDTGKVIDYNPAAESLFGYKKSTILGKNIDDFIIPSELVKAHKDAMAKHTLEGERSHPLQRRMEYPGVRSDGKMVELELALTSNILNDRVNFTAFIQDITDKKGLLKSLKETLDEAEAANQAKSEFLANMSHEIRTPMNAVLGFTDLALKAEISDKVRDYLQKTENASRSLMGIINDILDFSKVEAGRLQLDPVKFDLHQLFEHLADLFSKQVADKNIELIFLAPISYDKVLFGDVMRLEQILINLIRNAIKFTIAGSITVICNPEQIADKQYRLNFSVNDTGIGVEADVLPNLFAAFVQADSSTTRKYGGTGLGLSICKQLVMLMGGEISVTSNIGEGSEFTFDVLVDLHSKSQRKLPTIPESLWGKKALIVEDNSKVQEQIGNLLKSIHLHPNAVNSGTNAVECLLDSIKKGSFYEFVFIDWDMPTSDGLTAATQIIATLKAEAPKQPLPRIFLLIPFGSEAIQKEGEKLGINGFLDKPVTRTRLIKTITQDFDSLSPRSDRRSRKPLCHEEQSAKTICGARVLLAEDNDINQQIALELLQRVGIIVDIANNGKDALTMVMKYPYDAVIMDIHMPIMDGLTTTKEIRKTEKLKKLPIIAITTNSQPEEIKKCLDAGMNSHLDKPIRPERLYGILSKWIVIKEPPAIPNLFAIMDNPEELPDIVGIDVKDGMQRVADNQNSYMRLLSIFLNDHANTTQKAKEALKEDRLETILGDLHTIKGMTSCIGAISLHDATVRLHHAINEGSQEEKNTALATFANHLDVIINGLGGVKPSHTVTVENLPFLGELNVQIDRELVEPIVIELATHLTNNSLNYSKVLSKFKQIIEPTPAMILFGELEKQLSDYHFVEAFEVLQKIAQPLEIDLSGDLVLEASNSQATILIVDDQRSNIDLLKDILFDFNLLAALNGRRALEVVNSQNQPDIILLDVMMPEMNGYEVCRRLKNSDSTCDIPVIFVTARNEVADESEGFAVGGVDYITKPFHAEIIRHRVKSSLSLKQHHDQLESLVAARTMELEKARQEAEMGRNAAEAGNRAKSDFLAHMSHELRTPMNAILGMSEILEETTLTDTQEWCVSNLNHSGETLLTLINDILDLSKIEASQLVLEATNFDLRLAFQKTLELFKFTFMDKSIKLQRKIADDVPQWVNGDPTRLQQILLNLISNALKFTQKGFVEVSISVNADSDILFSVLDTGTGIPKEKQQEIFQPFTQADTSITRHHGGTGLGLTICSRLVDLMGGKIWFESEIDKGSTFNFTIPFPRVDEREIDAATTKQTNIYSNETDDQEHLNLKILLVEDTEENQYVIQGFLQKSNCQIDVAQNGAIGVEKFINSDFDVVLMDIQMPVMDGYTATRKIRQWEMEHDLKATPVIALTAHALNKEADLIMAAGCDLHLTKPIRKGRLIATLRNYQKNDSNIDISSQNQIIFHDDVAAKNSDSLESGSNEYRSINIETLNTLRHDIGGDIEPTLAKFLEKLPERLDNLKNSIARNDPEQAAKDAHKIKGSSSTLGALKLATLCQQFENLCHSEQYPGDGKISAEVFTEGEQVLVELKDILQGFSS
ncbi:MAG: response regulator [Magnetococcales bacterium]|nr:response regulator [Magnetococcales bacterium]